MNCPFCGKEMDTGFVQGNTCLTFVKRRHYLTLTPREGKGEVKLTGDSAADVLVGAMLPAQICRACRKVILDYAETEERENRI